MQWTRFHAERERENAIVQVEYADSGAASAGDLVIWSVEGAPLSSNVTGGTIPDIYGLDMNILTGLRVQRNPATSTTLSRIAAGVLLKNAPAIPVANLDSQIHPMYLAVAWGPARAFVDITVSGAIRTPLRASISTAGALSDVSTPTALNTLEVCAFLTEQVSNSYTGLANVWMKCI